MAASSLADAGYKFLLDCEVCSNRLKNPRLLTCGHHFCEKCLTSLAADYGNSQIKCPTCRSDTSLSGSGVEDLPRNYMAGELLENKSSLLAASQVTTTRQCDVCKNDDVTASTRCQDCARNMCEKCLRNHTKVEAFQTHTTVTITDLLFCREHVDVTVALFCMDCKVGICPDCVISKHSDHNTRDVGELATNTRKKLGVFLDSPEVKYNDHPMGDCLRDAAKEIDDNRAKYKSEISKLREAFRSGLVLLGQTETAIDAKFAAEGNSIRKKIDERASLNAVLENIRELADSLLKESSDIEVVVRGQNIPSPRSLRISTEVNVSKPVVRGHLDNLIATMKDFIATLDVVSEEITMCPVKPIETLTKVREIKVKQTIDGICLTREGGERSIVLRTKAVTAPIKIYNYNGALKKEFGSGIEGLCDTWARDIAVDNRRDLYITPCKDKIVRIDQSGALYDEMKLTGDHIGVVYIPDSDVYIVSAMTQHKVYVINAVTKVVIRNFGSRGDGNEQFNSPFYMCVYNHHPELTLAISNLQNHRVRVCDTRGRHVATYGTQGKGVGQLLYPRGVCVDPAGRLVVCDPGNDRVVSYWEEAGEVRWRYLLREEQLGIGHPRCVDIDIERKQLFVATDGNVLQMYSF